jgi:hypothetical protein
MIKLGMIFALTCASANLSLGQVVKTNESEPDTLITLQRGACEKRCAVYRLVIFADGTVIYEGRHFVRQTGIIRSGISPEVLSKLINDLETGGFFQLEPNYGYGNTDRCDSIDSDGPAAILSVSNQGRSKTVLHSHRCVGPVPNRVTELEDKVDRAVGTMKWIK